MSVDKNVKKVPELEKCRDILKSGILSAKGKKRDIYEHRFLKKETFDVIASVVGTTKQNVEVIVGRLLDEIYLSLRDKCIFELIKNYEDLSAMEKNVLMYLIKRKTKKMHLDKEVKKDIMRLVWIKESVPIDEVIERFLPNLDKVTAAFMLLKEGFKIKKGNIVGFEGSLPLRDQIFAVFLSGKIVSIEDIMQELRNRGVTDVTEHYVRSIVTWTGFKDRICNVGKSRYVLCDVLKLLYDVDGISEKVKRFMLEKDICDIDTRILVEKKIFDDPYLLKAILVVSGKFSRGKKFLVKLKTEECENKDADRFNRDIVFSIIAESRKPVSLNDIVRIAEQKYNRHLEKSSIPAILKSFKDKLCRVEGGYLLKEKCAGLKTPSEDIIVQFAKTLLSVFPRGFFLNMLLKELQKEGYDADRYLVKEVLSKNGFPIFGRSETMIVAPLGAKEDPIKTFLGELFATGEVGGKGSMKKIVSMVYEEFGGSVDIEKIETKVRNLSVQLKESLKASV